MNAISSVGEMFAAGHDARSSAAAACRRRGRRGVVLLIVLVLLVLLVTVALTWIIVARSRAHTSRAFQAAQRYDENYEDVLDEALLQVLRGSTNPYSAIGPHSLLEDFYGNDEYAFSAASGGAVLGSFPVDDPSRFPPSSALGLWRLRVRDPNLSRESGFYNGRLLTMLEGPAAGITMRIVGYHYLPSAPPSNAPYPPVSSGYYQAPYATPPGQAPFAAPESWFELYCDKMPPGVMQLHEDETTPFLINGRPFNGLGYVLVNQAIDAMGNQVPLPRDQWAIRSPTTGNLFLPNPLLSGVNNDPSGEDEDYDAPDFNNMLLAGRVWNSVQGRWEVVIPSLHRPALFNFMLGSTGIVDPAYVSLTPAERRAASTVRPLMTHADFALGNPSLHAFLQSGPPQGPGNAPLAVDTNGDGIPDTPLVWDVDNDGDGVPDSVWVDLGLPVQTDARGRYFKPLVAILCLDMDGRLNVNAHGSVEHLRNPAEFPGAVGPNELGALTTLLGGFVVRGQGYGPADVDLRSVAGAEVFFGTTARPGRYGEAFLAGSGYFFRPRPGLTGVADPWRALQDHQHDEHWLRYASPPDYQVTDRVAIGLQGALVHWKHARRNWMSYPDPATATRDRNDNVDNPYEFNPYEGRVVRTPAGMVQVDAPFAPQEEELLHRPYDIDVQQGTQGLPSRLVQHLGLNLALPQDRLRQGLLTTRSADTGSPSVRLTTSQLATPGLVPTGNHVTDLLTLEILRQNPGIAYLTNPNALNDAIRRLLSPDLAAGMRMDINRPEGNGGDDPVNLTTGALDPNGVRNFVVDDGNGLEFPGLYVGETLSGQLLWNVTDEIADVTNYLGPFAAAELGRYLAFNGIRFLDPNYSGVGLTTDINERWARQRYARHLYTLMMLLIEQEQAGQPGFRFQVPPNENARAYTARRVAQWAINCVDFKDRDVIMTPFVYDIYPFREDDGNLGNGTWDIPENIQSWIANFTDADGDGLDDNRRSTVDNQPYVGLVWGSERPELLITETLAWHDTRQEDRNDDPSGKYTPMHPNAGMNDDDTDLDQRRKPQGSLFIELYNPWQGEVPPELRIDPNDTRYGAPRLQAIAAAGGPINAVDLSRLAPGDLNRNPNVRVPVWRLVIGQKNPQVDANDRPDPRPIVRDQDIERIVWFVDGWSYQAETGQWPEQLDRRNYYSLLKKWNDGDPPNDKDFANRVNQFGFDPASSAAERIAASQMFLIPPGRYAVVGPRVRTKIGNSGPDRATSPKMRETEIRLLQAGTAVPTAPVQMVIDQSAGGDPDDGTSLNYPQYGNGDIRRPLGIVINGPRVSGWNVEWLGRGLSVSEPVHGDPYYAKPDVTNPTSIDDFDRYATVRDEPEDVRVGNGAFGAMQPDHRPNFRFVFLQRLANPLAPHHPRLNPYMTIDYLPIDVSIIHGEIAPVAHPLFSPHTRMFGSRQRTGQNAAGPANDIWSRHSQMAKGNNTQFETRSMLCTLGYLNGWYNTADANGDGVPDVLDEFFAAHPNRPLSNADVASVRAAVLGGLVESIALPIALELGIVNSPRNPTDPVGTNPAYDALRAAVAADMADLYVGTPADRTGPVQPRPFPPLQWNDRPYINALELMLVPASGPERLLRDFDTRRPGVDPYSDITGRGEFPHLINFFQRQDGNGRLANFYQLFEYVHVPSKFAGTDVALNPTLMMNDWANNPFSLRAMHPPFNRVSLFREPGRININTLFDDGTTWAAVMNDRDHLTGASVYNARAHFDKIWRSRHGAAGPGIGQLTFQPDFPSFYPAPFRSFTGHGVLAPGLRPDVGQTLLRPDPDNPARPLLAARTPTDPGDAGTLGPAATPLLDGDRAAALRYQPLQKIGNTLTTRSNVYAVWVTVGYFEMIPETGGPGQTVPRRWHPEGFRLGPELGLDDGSVVRHRAFFLIDRTVPVAFQRGKDHNVRDAVLVRSIIE
jgi:hypothetical protein